MADFQSDPDRLAQDIAGLGGDIRTHAHTILRSKFEAGLQAFKALIADDLAHCETHFRELEAQAGGRYADYFKGAGKQRDLFFATPDRIGYRLSSQGIRDFPPPHRIDALVRGNDRDYFLGMSTAGGVRIYRDGRANGVESLQRYPADEKVRIHYSLSDVFPNPLRSNLLWSGNKMIHYLKGKNHTVLTGNFDTNKHMVRQSMDVANSRLAFAMSREVYVLDLRRFLLPGFKGGKDIVLKHTAAGAIGGLSLWEGTGGVYVYATQPSRKQITFHCGPGNVGLFLDLKRRNRVELETPLIRGDRFTLEFWYRLPEQLPANLQIPLIGGSGYPSLWLDSATRQVVFRWAFPDSPTLRTMERRSARAIAAKAGEWVHLALTSNGKLLQLYQNGRKLLAVPSPEQLPLPSQATPMFLGNFTDTEYSSGKIGGFAELRTWDRARTAQEIRQGQKKWIVATADGLPNELIMYHRFWGTGMFSPRQVGVEGYRPSINTGRDIARPEEAFEIPRPQGSGSFGQCPLESVQVFWETKNRLGNWVAADAHAGIVAWSERFPDGKWYLMQAPASGHFRPQQVQEIGEWEVALVQTPNILAGDILAWASLEEFTALRNGFHQQVQTLFTAQARVSQGYQDLFAALDVADRNRARDTSAAEHHAAHQQWIGARNHDQRRNLDAQHRVHVETSQALRDAIREVHAAEQRAIQIRQQAQLESLRKGG